MTPDNGEASAGAGNDVERDTPMTGIYIRVLLVEAAVVVALWYFGRMFS
ncbi:MAG: hypothetical protein ABI868_09935 [Acidobacteriota bacterium]